MPRARYWTSGRETSAQERRRLGIVGVEMGFRPLEARRGIAIQAAAEARLEPQRESVEAECGVRLTWSELREARAEGRAAAWAWLNAERCYTAQHIGTVGKRIRGLELFVERCHSFDSAWGTMHIWVMRDRANNCIVIKSGACLGMTDPDGQWRGVQSYDEATGYSSRWFRCDATVKEHSTYKGLRQTIIQRAKVTAFLSDYIQRIEGQSRYRGVEGVAA